MNTLNDIPEKHSQHRNHIWKQIPVLLFSLAFISSTAWASYSASCTCIHTDTSGSNYNDNSGQSLKKAEQENAQENT